MYAAGKIPGSFFKREGRAGEKGTLTARMIDRPIRPLFPKGWHFETQLVNMPLSVDHEHPYDVLAMNGASAALMISPVPLPTPVGAVRIGKIEGNFVVNPSEADLVDNTDLDLVVAGTDEAILMVEAGANEVSEAEMLDALDIAHSEIKKLCALQRELAEKAGKEKLVDRAAADRRGPRPPDRREPRPRARRGHLGRGQARPPGRDEGRRGGRARAVLAATPRPRRTPSSASARSSRSTASRRRSSASASPSRSAVPTAAPSARSGRSRSRSASRRARTARRSSRAARRRRCRVAALGTLKEEMRLDTLGLETKKFYWHHYNFPPFSVGEAGFMRGPKRRDIGHGALAERALVPVVPSTEDFPYTIRVVSDILESNGSSSMASVCGSSLSLMDAGVPIRKPVAGIAMGLIKEGDDYTVLTDIAGVEDHLGDMDFKVAGTEDGITALQMDIKITGVTFDILRDALSQAKEARLSILGKMDEAIPAPRTELSPYAPRILTVKIDPDKIGLLIGKGGETIRALQDEFESQIDVNDEGQVLVYSRQRRAGRRARRAHPQMTKEVEVGDEYTGKVVKTTTFGAFVELAKGTDGLLHISNIAPGPARRRRSRTSSTRATRSSVRVVEVDRERGRIGLRLADDPEIAGKTERGARLGRHAAATAAARGVTATAAARGGDRGPRGGRRPRPRPRGDREPRGSGRPRHRSGADRDPDRG